MSVLEALYLMTIKPIVLVLEFVYSLAFHLTGNAGAAIVFLSVAVNIMVFPLYKNADKMQSIERERSDAMTKWVKHIKKTFRGDERVMMLNTYYRQNNYKPIYAIRGSFSLLLQVPFFVAAYRFLSELSILSGTSFLFIRDLAAPDGLVIIFGLRINILPILMTAVNIVSAFVYLKERPIKDKVQPLLLATVFLILLYPSPSGLVLYWLLNNVFSLIKNILQSCKKTGNVKKEREAEKGNGYKRCAFLFGASIVTLIIMSGILIPTSVIVSSPAEFVNSYNMHTPLLYVLHSLLVAVGFFGIWIGLYYFLASNQGKRLLGTTAFCIVVTALFNYLSAGRGFGIISSGLSYGIISYYPIEIVINTIESAAIIAVAILIVQRKREVAGYAVLVLTLVFLIMSGINMARIEKKYREVLKYADQSDDEPVFELSRSGRNVVVIMVDRAMNMLQPYIFEEKPELYEQFDGFTFYDNTISYGVTTNIASPAVFGGYEYTPERMNERSDESLESKHNEALRVMPVLFDENGYEVTVYDPPFAGYQEIPDLSIYDDHPNIRGYHLFGRYNPYGEALENRMEEVRKRDFFCYSLFRMSPELFQFTIYDEGRYNDLGTAYSLGEVYGLNTSVTADMEVTQKLDGLSKSQGLCKEFVDAYYALDAMIEKTEIKDTTKSSFWMLYNSTPHDKCYLQKPDYTPEMVVDNTEYDVDLHYEIDGRVMHLDNSNQVGSYAVNMATYLMLGKWLDVLRENGVYDNTRIIIVADHGSDHCFFDDTYYEDAYMEFVAPVLMVKDFDATGFNVSDEFMTNADVPTLAVRDVIENAKNPATGKIIDNSEKNQRPQNIYYSRFFDIGEDNGNVFDVSDWYSVHTDMRDPNNWNYLGNY